VAYEWTREDYQLTLEQRHWNRGGLTYSPVWADAYTGFYKIIE